MLIFNLVYRQARGMYFSIKDKGELSQMVYNWPYDVKIIVVTDGSRVLGLGDLGSNGMPIPVGKLALYVAAGGINPRSILPVVIDVGTNNTSLRNNSLYLGIPEERIDGHEYYEFLDEWIHAVYSRWPRVLVQFEDFKNPHAQTLLNKYREKFCTFNDDIQSTGAIALAGLFSSLKARGRSFNDLAHEKIVCVGAGSAGIGVCETIVEAMLKLGLVSCKKEAYKRFYLVDQFGLIGKGRNEAIISNLQLPFRREDLEDGQSLHQVVKDVKPTVLLGLSGVGGLFTEEVVREMSKHVDQPVIFPLSNPTKNSECTAAHAFEWTDGKVLFASGSPFDDVLYQGKLYSISQWYSLMI
jgi:malic enzyme